MSATAAAPRAAQLEKCPTGIHGLDEITAGGLPRGRPTLVCGDAGSGKTILGMQFLVQGITQFNEPGVFIAFEENAQDLAINMASMGVDVGQLCAENKLAVDWVHLSPAEIEEAGEYDLEGLFIRIQCAVERVHARRIVLDSIEALFSTLRDETTLRSELQRLFNWLKERQLTAVVTGERGDGRLTRHGLEEYVADCVISLDHDVVNQVSTRHVRVVKYRGSVHGANQYPFLIGKNGFSVFPITSLGLECSAPSEQISSGIPRLDSMLRGGGFYRGSSILVSGAAGSGKTSMAAHFVRAACERGERALYFGFEESQAQILRNMRSIGIDLAPWVERGLLQFHAARPSLCGLETHLAMILAAVTEFEPRVIVLDPLSDFLVVGSHSEVKGMLTRLIDYLKIKQITALFTSLTSAEHEGQQSEAGISSLIDSWLLLRNLEQSGERNRALYLLKSRGMAHSTQVREFLLTDEGVDLVDVCVSAGGVMVGSARREYEARQVEEALRQKEEAARKRLQLERRRRDMEAQIESLRRQFEEEERELAECMQNVVEIDERATSDRDAMTRSREQGPAGRSA
ncbi:MAG TPA: circadian clock protein KaiC [Terriglobales bacterium]|nr:circadian clock protein KaiC [Terriglobales bacterium]